MFETEMPFYCREKNCPSDASFQIFAKIGNFLVCAAYFFNRNTGQIGTHVKNFHGSVIENKNEE
jgi:hypothetical protein